MTKEVLYNASMSLKYYNIITDVKIAVVRNQPIELTKNEIPIMPMIQVFSEPPISFTSTLS
jgi:hypothetical protein